jgi:nicotinamidase-related amidase
MQNFFVHPMYHDHSSGIATIDPLLKVIDKCKGLGIQRCWLNWGISDYDLKVMPAAVTRGFNRNLAQDKGHGWHVGLGANVKDDKGNTERCLFSGTWNADIYDPLKKVMTPEDVRFDKARMSGMWNPDLPMNKWLRESGKKTLLFAGVNTDQCLLGTVTDAYNWGWYVTNEAFVPTHPNSLTPPPQGLYPHRRLCCHHDWHQCPGRLRVQRGTEHGFRYGQFSISGI